MYALIDPRYNNRICEIQITTFPVAEPLEWVSCGDNVTTEWTYNGVTFEEAVVVESSAPSLTDEQKLSLIRIERDKRLAASDWTQLIDTTLTINQVSWATYRQELRDFPNNPSLSLDAPAWPAPPSA